MFAVVCQSLEIIQRFMPNPEGGKQRVEVPLLYGSIEIETPLSSAGIALDSEGAFELFNDADGERWIASFNDLLHQGDDDPIYKVREVQGMETSMRFNHIPQPRIATEPQPRPVARYCSNQPAFVPLRL